MSRIRALIVDDEPPARRKVRRFLEEDADIDVVAEAGSGGEAVRAIRRHAPDLVFLDVHMPDFDGFDVIAAIDQDDDPPIVVFVTAYDEYALRAFDVHAVDYLLKPFDDDRFRTALERAKVRIRHSRDRGDAGLRALIQELRQRPERLQRLLVESRGRAFFISIDRIDWIEAAGNYVRLHVGGETHLVRGTLGGLQARLDPDRFIRVHRSRSVNIDRISELHPWSHGEYVIVLKDGTRLRLSRRYRDRLSHLFGRQF